ncbi:MSC_0619 family F1-like ATPase alpha subunit [Mycoplasmopsis gallinarum]|uniref:MSC_0619 family F1-like ATPase alpha subunit n=1 Tax=Mycoplasmopsis gallinarum TaxID=29557 RepID=UPI0009DD9C3E|nr:ATP F0F1 synthase subunit alpha [Mycoplasmopsis gallinarum]
MKQPIITAIFDYVVELSGEFKYEQNQFFNLKKDNSIQMMLISATETKAYALVNKKIDKIQIGSEVEIANQSNQVKTNRNMFGKIVDIQGNVLYPNNNFLIPMPYEKGHDIFNSTNTLLDYQPLNEPLYTGLISIDLLIPIGKGQRELIIGDRKTGKTQIALNTIINQKGKNVKCIYVGIGQQQAQIANVYKTLSEHNAMEYTMIIDANSSNPYDQYLAPYIGMAHAENISYEEDVLIIFDNLTNHANIVRELALLINKPVGKEAFPGDMFYLHSKLLERSGKFKNRKSITAFPIIQTVENDITSLIASNVISITDGQIVTNSDLFASGKLPAVDIDLSVSRIGGSVQKKYVAKVAAQIAKIYKTYKKQIKLASLKSDLNDEMIKLINAGETIEKMFVQRGISSYSEELMYLTSKLIAWNALTNIEDTDLALKFVDLFAKENQLMKQIVQNLIENKQESDLMAKNFFMFCLKSFAQANNLKWNIEVDANFAPLNEKELQNIYAQITKGVK